MIQKKKKEVEDSQYIYPNKLDKVCFQYDMTYRDFKYLTRTTASNKMLCDKEFNIAKISKYDGYQRGIFSSIYKNFTKKNF